MHVGDFSTIQIKAGLASSNLKIDDTYWCVESKTWKQISMITDTQQTSTQESVPVSTSDANTTVTAKEPETFIEKVLGGIGYFGLSVLIIAARYYVQEQCKRDKTGEWNVWTWTFLSAFVACLVYAGIRGALDDKKAHVPKPFFKRGLAAIITLSLLVGTSFSPKARQAWLDFNPLRPALAYEPFGDFQREIFPSIELGFAHLSEKAVKELAIDAQDEAFAYRQRPQGSTIGVILHDVRKGDRYTIKVSSEGADPSSAYNRPYNPGLGWSHGTDQTRLLKASSYTFEATQDSPIALASPELIYDFNAISQVSQTQPINLTFEVSRNGGTPLAITQVWQVRQIHDCPIGMKSQTVTNRGDIKEEVMNTTFFFSAYVNENHPMVDELITEALNTGKVNAFTGYQHDRNSVLRQMEAIWTALEHRGIRYSSITATTGSESSVQHVRLIEDTLRSSQANCVDGSILFASIARKVGLDPVLVIVPGHCYVAIDAGNELIGVEMTMLGSRSFHEAVDWATSQSPRSITKNLFKFTRPSPNQQHFLISISDCRDFGIQPIPYHGK